jgi:Ca2+-binding EF-hand superfamily protein
VYLCPYTAVDEDGSGKIEFDEFLGIMLNIKRGNETGKSNNSAMFDFFKRNLRLTQD